MPPNGSSDPGSKIRRIRMESETEFNTNKRGERRQRWRRRRRGMVRVFSVDEISDLWPPVAHPPFPASKEDPKMNRSASEWAFQRVLQEAAASSVSDTTSSSKSVGDKDAIEIKDDLHHTNAHSSQGCNRKNTGGFPQPHGILSEPKTKVTDTGLSVPVDSDGYQEYLKSCLNLACAVVALTKLAAEQDCAPVSHGSHSQFCGLKTEWKERVKCSSVSVFM